MTTRPPSDRNVIPLRQPTTTTFPRCTQCGHEFHGLPCTVWTSPGASGATCPCDSSLDTEPGGDAA